MIRRYAHQGVQWVDLESPTAEEVGGIADEFALGANLVYELVTPTETPRVDVYPLCVYAVFHFPSARNLKELDDCREIDIILGKNYLITTHYRPLEAVDDFARAFEVDELLQRDTAVSSGYLLLELAGRLYRESRSTLNAMGLTIDEIENVVFFNDKRALITKISMTARELIVHKRILGNHAETLEMLENASVTLFGDGMRAYLHGIAALHRRTYARAVSMVDTVTELRETNHALLSTRQNEIMKNLTIITSVMLPLTLIANIFSMQAQSVPLVNAPNGFWLVLGLMILVSLAFALYFKLKKWF